MTRTLIQVPAGAAELDDWFDWGTNEDFSRWFQLQLEPTIFKTYGNSILRIGKDHYKILSVKRVPGQPKYLPLQPYKLQVQLIATEQ